MTVKVEVCMVGHVVDSLLIRCGIVIDSDCIVIRNSICYLHHSISRKTKFSVGKVDCKDYGITLFLGIPDSSVNTVYYICVKVVLSVINRHLV